MSVKSKLSRAYIRLENMMLEGNWRTPFAVMVFLGTGGTIGFIAMAILYWLAILDVLGAMLIAFIVISVLYWIVSMIGKE